LGLLRSLSRPPVSIRRLMLGQPSRPRRPYVFGSFFLVSISPSEFLHIIPAHHLSELGMPRQGFWLSSRHHVPASTRCERSQSLTTFRPQAFSASRRFSPQGRFMGLFHPTTTSRVQLFKGFSLRSASLPHRKELPLCRWLAISSSPKQAAKILVPRL